MSRMPPSRTSSFQLYLWPFKLCGNSVRALTTWCFGYQPNTCVACVATAPAANFCVVIPATSLSHYFAPSLRPRFWFMSLARIFGISVLAFSLHACGSTMVSSVGLRIVAFCFLVNVGALMSAILLCQFHLSSFVSNPYDPWPVCAGQGEAHNWPMCIHVEVLANWRG